MPHVRVRTGSVVVAAPAAPPTAATRAVVAAAARAGVVIARRRSPDCRRRPSARRCGSARPSGAACAVRFGRGVAVRVGRAVGVGVARRGRRGGRREPVARGQRLRREPDALAATSELAAVVSAAATSSPATAASAIATLRRQPVMRRACARDGFVGGRAVGERQHDRRRRPARRAVGQGHVAVPAGRELAGDRQAEAGALAARGAADGAAVEAGEDRLLLARREAGALVDDVEPARRAYAA